MIRFNVDEAAAYARRHPNTIRRLLEVGDLHGSQPVKGGRWLIREDCLDSYLDGEHCTHRQKSNVTALRNKRPA